MIDNQTSSILQRVPRILAVTAASYGLNTQAPGRSATQGNMERPRANEGRQGKPH